MPFVVAVPAATIGILGAALTLLGARPGVLTGFAFGFGATLLLVNSARRPYGRISAPGWSRTILTGIVCVTSLFLLGRPLLGMWAGVVAAAGGLACAAADRRIGARQAARNLHRTLVAVTILAIVGAVVPQLVAASALIAGAGVSMLLPADLMTRLHQQVLKIAHGGGLVSGRGLPGVRGLLGGRGLPGGRGALGGGAALGGVGDLPVNEASGDPEVRRGDETSGDVETSQGRESLPGQEVWRGREGWRGTGVSREREDWRGLEASPGQETSRGQGVSRGHETSRGHGVSRGHETEALALAAFLDPTDIPKSLLDAAAVRAGAGRASSLRTLAPGALIEVAPDSLRIDPLVQEFARRRMLPGERRAWAGRAVKMLAESFPQEPSVLANRLVPHASAAVGHAEMLGVERAGVLLLLNQVAAFLAVSGRPEEAQTWRERAIARASKDFAGSSAEAAELLVASDPKTPKAPKKSKTSKPAKPSKKPGDVEQPAAEPPVRDGSSSVTSSDPPTLVFPALGGPLPHGSSVYTSSSVSGADVTGPASGEPASGPPELDAPEPASTTSWSAAQPAGAEPEAARSYHDTAAASAVGPPGVPVASFERLLSGTDRAAFAFRLAELGDARRDAGDLAGARRDYRLALRRARRVLPRKHPLRDHLRAQLAALPSPRSPESNERRLVLGCFTLIVVTVLTCVSVAVLRGMDEAGVAPSDDQLTSVDQLVGVCHTNQRYFPGAARFAGAEPHPALVFRRTTNDESFVRDPFGGHSDPRRIQLVACAVQVQTGPPLAVCKSPGQQDIPLHQASYQVNVYETWTGHRLGQQTISAGRGTCPTSFVPPPQDKPWMLYAAPTDDQYRQVIQPVFDLLPAIPASPAASPAG